MIEERHPRAAPRRARPAERALTVANSCPASTDARASQGRSGGLGDDGDKAVFRALRRASDAVLVGTGTLAHESYGRIVADPDARRARVARGVAAEPLAVTLTRSGRLPLKIPLFAEPEARVIVFSGAEVDLGDARAQVEVVRLDRGQLSFAARPGPPAPGARGAAGPVRGRPGVLGALLRETGARPAVPEPGRQAHRRRRCPGDHQRPRAAGARDGAARGDAGARRDLFLRYRLRN